MVTSASMRYEFLTIVTFGRSGSTAIQAALNAHPHTIIRGENYSALRGLQAYVEAVAAAADRHHSGKAHHPWYGTARLDPVAVLADQRRHVIENLLRPKSDTRWLGFKEVRYEVGHFAQADDLAAHLFFLNALLPGMRFVINTRDPQSAAQSGWWREHPDAVAALQDSSRNLHDAANLLAAVLGPGRVVSIEHEHWRSNAAALVEALVEIGFPADSAIVKTALAEQLDHGKQR